MAFSGEPVSGHALSGRLAACRGARRPPASLHPAVPALRAPALAAYRPSSRTRRGPQRRPGWRDRDEEGPRKSRGPTVSFENKRLLQQLRSEELGEEEVRQLVGSLIQESQLERTREYTLFMGELGRRQLWEESLALLGEREERGARLDVQVCNSAIAACAKAGRWDHAVHILNGMWRKDVVPDMVSYNIALGACEQAGEWRQALSVLDEMQRCRRRNFFTFNASVGACVQGRQWARALDLMDEMLYWDVTPDWRMYNLGIIMAGDGQQWQIAIGLLADMWQREVLPDTVTFSAAIGVCELCGRWQEALHLVGDMRRKGFALDAATCASVARACRSGGQGELAEALERSLPPPGPGQGERPRA